MIKNVTHVPSRDLQVARSSMRVLRRFGLAVLVLASNLYAVKPETWKQSDPKDFAEGTFDNVTVTSDGELMLARAVTKLADMPDGTIAVNALVRGPDNALYAATSGKGQIWRIKGETVELFATLDDDAIYSLIFAADDRLFAGTGGQQGRLFAIDADGKVQLLSGPDDVQYIWAMVRGSDGEIYAATGANGKLLRFSPDAQTVEVLYDADQKNLLCLAADKTGMLYAGTDEEGLVYRIDPEKKQPYVLYDAPESEISSLAIDASGNVFAATASAEAAKPGRALGARPGGQPDNGNKSTNEGKTATTGPTTAMARATAASKPGHPAGATPPGEGNAIYRIDRDGFVTEVFRQPVMILALAEAGGRLYAATGNEGRIYEIQLDREINAAVAKLDVAQVVTLLRLENGEFIVGTANPARLARVAHGYAPKGTFISKPLDAKQIVRFGVARWRADIPGGATLTLATRSGNTDDPDTGTWDKWSAEFNAGAGVQIPSPSARLLQYRLTLATDDDVKTPKLTEIEFVRQEENRPPKIEALRVGSVAKLSEDPSLAALKAKLAALASRAGDSNALYAIVYKAEDPNGDDIVYDLYYRQVGNTRWIKFGDEQTEPIVSWDSQTVADGQYEFRVVARDTPSNPPGTDLSFARRSDPFIVDNTPPVITLERVQVDGNRLRVRAVVRDALSPIREAHYTINSYDKWIATEPSDDIFDNRNETIEFVADDLKSGEVCLVLRATDTNGNTAHATATAVVP